MNMLDVFKGVLQEGMEMGKVKEFSKTYKFPLTYKGMTANCILEKVCALHHEETMCKRVINNAISEMYINAGNLSEAKAWLDGERWGGSGTNTNTSMEINLSSKSIDVIVNSLRDSKRSLKVQITKWDKANESNKLEICKAQLADVEEVLSIFEEQGY